MSLLRNINVKLSLGETGMWRLEEEIEQNAVWYDIFVNCNWVATWWQQYSTLLHTNNTQNNKMIQNTQNETYIIIRIYKHYNQCTYCTKLTEAYRTQNHMQNEIKQNKKNI